MAKSRANPGQSVGKAKDPYTDGSVVIPELEFAANTWASYSRDIGSYGLRQWGGWVREEFLPQLRGRELSRTYREMLDNNATIGAIVHAITQAMRSVRWREVPANDSPEAQRMAEFAASLREDMSQPWDEFIAEALTMIGYGFAPMEMVFKKRQGRKSGAGDEAGSKHKDGLVGFRRLPIRGQDTILKWYFDRNGQITGMQQQPWVGPLIDIPIEKLLLFRPTAHKNNPEGRSPLRSAYRAHHFIKRLEEMEAILFERLSGIPVVKIPNQMITAAQAGDKAALASYNAFKTMVTNVRINEQMGIILPSDTWMGANGPSTEPMYRFELVTPQAGHVVDPAPIVQRYKLDILKSVLADFIDLGHQARGTQNLAITKIDMFYKSIEGWLNGMAATYDRHGVARAFRLNAFDEDLQPETKPDMATRVDLDQLGNYFLHLFQSGVPLANDPEVVNYMRHQAGMPEFDEGEDGDRRELMQPAIAPTGALPLESPTDTPAQRSAAAVVRVAARKALRAQARGSRRPNIVTKTTPGPELANGHGRTADLAEAA